MYATGSSSLRGATLAFCALPFAFFAGALQGSGLEKHPEVRLFDLTHTEPDTAGLRLVSPAQGFFPKPTAFSGG